MGENEKIVLRPYPIQLGYVSVQELRFEANRPLDANFRIDPQNVNILSTFSGFDPSDKSVQIGLGAEFGHAEESEQGGGAPLKIRVRVVGHFTVNDDAFPMERLEEWGRRNAPMILFPFLREHVFALTSRCGVSPVVLPLVHLPTVNLAPDAFNVAKEKASSTQQEPELGLTRS